MIINQSIGFVFIHIPKAAGTSITRYLSPLNNPFDLEIGGSVFGEEVQSAYKRRYNLSKHSSLSELSETISLILPRAKMFTFSFVRNPYTRIASIFSFLRRWDDYNPELRKLMHSFNDLEAFVASGIFEQVPGPDRMFRPQFEWLSIDGQLDADLTIYKIEFLKRDVRKLRNELIRRGASQSKFPEFVPHANKSNSSSAKEMNLSSKSIERLNSFYENDFHFFRYRKLNLR